MTDDVCDGCADEEDLFVLLLFVAIEYSVTLVSKKLLFPSRDYFCIKLKGLLLP